MTTFTHLHTMSRWVGTGMMLALAAGLIATVGCDRPDAEKYVQQGRVHLSAGEHDPAIEDFDSAIEIDPESFEAHMGRGAAYTANEEHGRAIQDLDAAIRLDPEYVEAYCLRGLLLKASGDAEGSARDLEKSAALGHDCES